MVGVGIKVAPCGTNRTLHYTKCSQHQVWLCFGSETGWVVGATADVCGGSFTYLERESIALLAVE